MDLLIRLIIWLITLVMALFVGIESDMTGQSPPSDGSNTMRVPIMVDNVEVNLLESFPVQVTLDVTGTIQDGCDFPVITEIGQSDNSITVNIYREVPTDVMCPMNIQVYEDTIDLGTFDLGSYTVDVNGIIVTFEA